MEYIKGYFWHKNNYLSPPLSDTRYDFDKLVKKGNNSFKNGLIKLQYLHMVISKHANFLGIRI
jgi:hypothetical protein